MRVSFSDAVLETDSETGPLVACVVESEADDEWAAAFDADASFVLRIKPTRVANLILTKSRSASLGLVCPIIYSIWSHDRSRVSEYGPVCVA